MNKEQQYCLGLLAEECGEVVQLVGKALRFGYDVPEGSYAPYNGQTPREMLHKECGDILAAINFAADHGYLNRTQVQFYCTQKYGRLTNPEAKDVHGNQFAPQPPTPGTSAYEESCQERQYGSVIDEQS